MASVGPLLRLAEHRIRFSEDQGRIRVEILDLLRAARAAPPDLNEIGVHLAQDAAEVHAVAAAMQAMGGDRKARRESGVFAAHARGD